MSAKNEFDFVKIEIQELVTTKYEIPKKYETRCLENGKFEVGNTKISNYSKLELDLEEFVRFHNRFLSKRELIKYLQATDCP